MAHYQFRVFFFFVASIGLAKMSIYEHSSLYPLLLIKTAEYALEKQNRKIFTEHPPSL